MADTLRSQVPESLLILTMKIVRQLFLPPMRALGSKSASGSAAWLVERWPELLPIHLLLRTVRSVEQSRRMFCRTLQSCICIVKNIFVCWTVTYDVVVGFSVVKLYLFEYDCELLNMLVCEIRCPWEVGSPWQKYEMSRQKAEKL